MILPFPSAQIKTLLMGKKRVIDVEDNATGQLGGVINQYTCCNPTHYILKYTGRPMTTTEVHDALKAILDNKAIERQVLAFGA
jgi:2-oxoglutarate/2-oxoacid ferredoxin oxidoreductase subunit alpha